MTLNWRGLGASVQAYTDAGRYLLTYVYQAMMPSVLVKLLWPTAPYWALVAGIPASLVVCLVVGWIWRQYGWMQQSAEMPLVNKMSWQAHVEAVHRWRIIRALDLLLRRSGPDSSWRCVYGDIPAELPAPVRDLLASTHRPPRGPEAELAGEPPHHESGRDAGDLGGGGRRDESSPGRR